MKKILSVVLICAMMVLSLVSCSNKKEVVVRAKVTENSDSSISVCVLDDHDNETSQIVQISRSTIGDVYVSVGDIVKVTTNKFSSSQQEIKNVIRFTVDAKSYDFKEEWLHGEVESFDWDAASAMVITEIYQDCFFATHYYPFPGKYKINYTKGQIDGFCVGDQFKAEAIDAKRDAFDHNEATLVKIETSNERMDPLVAYKPVIYFYPEVVTNVDVSLSLNGELTCTYPKYKDGWNITAYPDGTLVDQNGKTYNYLYWEGTTNAKWDFSEGFCIKGEDTADFLEVALEKLGLTRKEANEFIVFWLPMMQENEYNVISFQKDAYINAAPLNVVPTPDTMIRVFMTWYGTDDYVSIKEQNIVTPERNGFTVVEWGGTKVK